jgi:hypothetical protein
MVTAAPSIHRDIVALTEQLRDLQKSSATLEATLVELPVDDLDRLRRRYGASGSALVQALMLDRSAQILWRRSLAVADDQEASMRIENEDAECDVACTLTRTKTEQPMAMLHVSDHTREGWTYEVELPLLLAGRRPGMAVQLGEVDERLVNGQSETGVLARVLAVRRLD